MNPLPRAGRRQRLARLTQRTRVLPLLEVVRSLLRRDLRILAYHRVLEDAEPEGFRFDVDLISASAESFRRQMLHIREHFTPLRFDQVLSCIDADQRLPEDAVLVTFDDGYDDNYRVAFPILRDLGMSAMFFVSTGHIDTGEPYTYDWLVHMVCTTGAGMLHAPELGVEWEIPAGMGDRRQLAVKLLDRVKLLDDAGQAKLVKRLEKEWNLPRAAGHADCRPMTWDQLREMSRDGMEIGSHGVGHRMLAKLSVPQMTEEVVQSKATLERELGVPAQVLSYPVGGPDAFDSVTVESVRAAGFRMACSYIAGCSGVADGSRYSMHRLPVEREMDHAWFGAMVSVPELFSYTSRTRTG